MPGEGIASSAVLAHESELHFELGGPAYRLMQRIGLIKGQSRSIGRRVVAFLLITWVPLLLFSLAEGRALGPTPRESFLLDFATYARFFLAIPLIFIAEAVAGERIRGAGLRFVQANLVRPENLPVVEAAVVRSRERREAIVPELIMVVVALLGGWFTVETWTRTAHAVSWNSITAPGVTGLSMTGLWYHMVAVPILQFFALRWLWRLTIWTMFLFRMSRLELNLVATHPDRAGGLGFLAGAHVSLAIFAVALSCILSAQVGFELYFEGARIESYKVLLVTYLVVVEIVCLGPLLIFAPMLSRTKRRGARIYGLFAQSYNREFEHKWVTGETAAADSALGSADIQSLADLGASYDMVREMKILPFTKGHLLQIAIVSALPGLPLVLLIMPVGEILKLLGNVIL
jgi:hypothetical protein